ncbi:hypothetical protein EVAR_57805_1 [Eumeta japonica]|uniref:Uncharacterized protein n=1 Tax=Eumeta variegata TaxID=151549 RepID=A0A4C1Z4W4_EUMVA|nr:hypothetical protein EVAR_57805_1 [Eumeta japonica]
MGAARPAARPNADCGPSPLTPNTFILLYACCFVRGVEFFLAFRDRTIKTVCCTPTSGLPVTFNRATKTIFIMPLRDAVLRFAIYELCDGSETLRVAYLAPELGRRGRGGSGEERYRTRY